MQIGVNSQLYLGTIFYKSIPPEVFIEKGILKICRKFTGEHLRQSVISIKLESIFIGITLRHWVHFYKFAAYFRSPFLQNTAERLLLILIIAHSNHY